MIKGCTNIGTLSELCQAHVIKYCDMMEEMLRFIKQTAEDDSQLPPHPTTLGLHPVERIRQLDILVSDFQEADVFQIHQAHYTGKRGFRNGRGRNVSVWVQTGWKESYRDLHGPAVARLLSLF